MAERIHVLDDWPQPASVADPRIIADDTRLVLRYATSDSSVAVICFAGVLLVQFGEPNDEALSGHPLYGRCLQFYSVHEVVESSRIGALERQNAVHEKHSPELFSGAKHYIFTFQDSTLEVIGRTLPEIAVLADEAEAEARWRKRAGLVSHDAAQR